MKKIFLMTLLISNFSFAAEEAKSPDKPADASKLTTKDAKKACKDDGKTGAELIQCMKDKKGEK